MKNKTFQYKGKEYPIVFNINVITKIQERYGSLNKWVDLTDKGVEPNFKAIIFGITEMINEGIDIENEDKEIKQQPLSYKQVGRIISEIGISEMTTKMQQTVVESTKSNEKNA